MRVPSRRARRNAPLGAHRLTPVCVRTSRMSAAGRPTASLRAHPVRRSPTGFTESTVASRSTMIRAWGNCSNACSESVRSLAMSSQYRHGGAYFRLQLLEPSFELERTGAQNVLVEADVADRLAAEAGLKSVETEPRMVWRGLLRDPPPVVGVAAEGLEVKHRLPVQQVIRHQLPLAVARAAEEVIGGLAQAEDHDPAKRVTLVLREVEPHLVRRAEEVKRRLVISHARQVDALPFAGVGRQAREGRDIARGAHGDTLLLREVQVVAGLRLEARLERVRVEVDAQQPRRLRLDGLTRGKTATLEEGRPLVTDPRVRLDAEDQPPPGGRALLQGIEDEQAVALGHHGTAWHVIGRPARIECRAALKGENARAALMDEEPLDAPSEARLQLAPFPALQQVRLGLGQQQLVPGLRPQSLAWRDSEGGLRQTRADPRAQTAPPGESSARRRGSLGDRRAR